jgi:hypothetical protein
MLVNVLTRYAPRPAVVLELTLVENSSTFGSQAIGSTRKYLQPSTVLNGQGFGANRVTFALKTVAPVRLVNAGAFGAHSIANIVPGTHMLAPTRLPNSSQFGVPTVRFATKLLAPAKVVNSNQFGTLTVSAAPAQAVSAILPSELNTTFVDSDGTARSSIAGGAFVNLDA